MQGRGVRDQPYVIKATVSCRICGTMAAEDVLVCKGCGKPNRHTYPALGERYQVVFSSLVWTEEDYQQYLKEVS